MTDIELLPGNFGKDCPGNGEYIINGQVIECCCDECDYMMCCFEKLWQEKCKKCDDESCRRRKMLSES